MRLNNFMSSSQFTLMESFSWNFNGSLNYKFKGGQKKENKGLHLREKARNTVEGRITGGGSFLFVGRIIRKFFTLKLHIYFLYLHYIADRCKSR